MKAGMKLILAYKYHANVNEEIVLCGDDHEWATYVRYNTGDYYGHYFFDQRQAIADYLERINDNI